MRYRVDELALKSGASVDTIRFYQTRGLIPPPAREGRLAWYSDIHLQTVRRIRDLKAKGFTLASIQRLLNGDLDPSDEALVEAVAKASEDDGPEEFLTLEQLADRVGVSPALLQGLERDHLLVPRVRDGLKVYTSGDARAASAGLALLEAGLPLSELLDLARMHDASVRKTAERAVDLFVEHIRHPIKDSAASVDEAAERLVAVFLNMLPATVALVAHHFRRVLLAAAQARIEQVGEEHEIEAVRKEAAKRLEPAWPA